MFKLFFLAAMMTVAVAKPGSGPAVFAPLAYTAPVAAAYSAYTAPVAAAYSAPIGAYSTPLGAYSAPLAYSAYSAPLTYASPYSAYYYR